MSWPAPSHCKNLIPTLVSAAFGKFYVIGDPTGRFDATVEPLFQALLKADGSNAHLRGAPGSFAKAFACLLQTLQHRRLVEPLSSIARMHDSKLPKDYPSANIL